MGFWDSVKDVGSAAFAPVTGGLSLVGMGEDTLSRVPLLGPLLGAESDSEKALLKKQQQMAEEAKKRQAINQRTRMNALGQQLLAFNPQNQAMAKMFGPEAAFSPEQIATMGQNPMGEPQLDPALMDYRGTDPKKRQQIEAFMAEKDKYYADEKRRREMLMGGLSPLPPGPAPLQQRVPQPGRRY